MVDYFKKGSWIKQALDKKEKTQIGLAEALGVDPASVSRMISGERRIKADELKTIFAYLEIGATDGAKLIESEISKKNIIKPFVRHGFDIAEIDARAGAGLAFEMVLETFIPGHIAAHDPSVKQLWDLPPAYLQELGIKPSTGRIIEIVGDSMEPTLYSGDRILVDLTVTRPSPPGLFVLWDGLGIVAKRVEHIPGSDPVILRILSDNPRHSPYERTAEEIRIIGRVIWLCRKI